MIMEKQTSHGSLLEEGSVVAAEYLKRIVSLTKILLRYCSITLDPDVVNHY